MLETECIVMRRTLVGFFAVLILCGFGSPLTGQSAQQETEAKAVTNKKCPISNTEVSDKLRVEYKGQYVYLCCEGCVTEFNKDPEKYVAKLSKEDQEAIKPNTECPLTHEPVNKALSVEYQGRKVYFCCENCVEKFKKDHEKKSGE
jgi:YHS domain-containing protein